jgi:hypothetical protein
MRLAIALLLLAACQREPVESVPDRSLGGGCEAPKARSLVGKRADDALVARAKSLTGAKLVRRIAPDTAVTMDYRTDRLNVETDESGMVTGIRCG